jgi:outer membrane protein
MLNIYFKKKNNAFAWLLLFLLRIGWCSSSNQIPATLRDLEVLALKNQPLLRQNQAQIQFEKGLEIETRSTYYPQINFDNSYQRGNTRFSSFGVSTAFTVYNSVFSLNQFITDFGKTDATILASTLNVAQAAENYQASYEQVLFNVAQAYYTVLADRALVKVQQNSLKSLTDHLHQAEAFFKVGKQPKIDVTQAEVNLYNGRLSLVQAQNNFAIAETNLENAVGIPGLDFSNLEGKLSYHEFPIALQDALNTAYANRPDLKALEDELASQKASLDAANKAQNPTLAGSASYGWNSDTFFPGNRSWSFGVTLNFPLFNGFYTQGEVEAVKAQLEETQAQIDSLKLSIRQNVEQAYLNLQAAKTSLEVANKSLQYAEENFHLAKGEYEVGTGNYLQFTDAEVSLVQAKTNQIQALANYNIAVASLKQAMGTLQVEPK